jgi:hypothetical protein
MKRDTIGTHKASKRGLLTLVSTSEELLERESGAYGLEIRKYGRRDPSRWTSGTIYPQKLTLTSPKSGGRSVGIVRSQTQDTDFSFIKLQISVTIMKVTGLIIDIVMQVFQFT